MAEATRIDRDSLLPTNRLISTTCPYCGVGCGVDVEVSTDKDSQTPKLTHLSGTPEHPANYARLCVKGSNLLATNVSQGRLLKPEVDGQQVSWESAVSTVASKFKDIIQQHGADSVAFYVSGQLLTEDYYVANKLMKGYIGSANIDTNSRLCMSSAVAAYKRAFGTDSVPTCYEDLEQTELLILIGSNAAWTHPVLFQRMERAKQQNPNLKVVFIDPRKTASCELGDLHLAIKPGTDVALFNGLLKFLADNNGINRSFEQNSTEGLDAALAASNQWSVENVASFCDINKADLLAFYQLFNNTNKVLSFYSMGVNQSSSGVDKANGIINCHLASGKIGKLGCGPFSITGQPNAMGGREVGGLANMLAAHMDIENPVHQNLVQEYWNSPSIANQPGCKAVDLFQQIEQGKIKAVWIMATNPVVSMPNRAKIESALAKCECVVVSDYVANNDTLRFADIKLPATSWSEKNGTVTNSERRISRQRGLLTPTGEAKHDWQIICEVAKEMGFEQGFNFSHPSQIFNEHAGLTAYKNDGQRALDLSLLADLSQKDYDNLRPVQWPINQQNPSGTQRMFVDGEFFTASKKAQIIPLEVKSPQQQTSHKYPYVLNSGRIRDQWHTMTRTGVCSKLSKHVEQPFLAIHPEDALKLSVADEDIVAVNSAVSEGKIEVQLRVKVDANQRKGEVFAPIHWSNTNASAASIAALYSDANDPLSGQPELKHAAVSICKVEYELTGHLFSRQALSTNLLNAHFDYWTQSTMDSGYALHFSLLQETDAGYTWIQQNLPLCDEWIVSKGDEFQYIAGFRQGELDVVFFVNRHSTGNLVSWIESLFAQSSLTGTQWSALLRATPDETFKQGKTICSCFNVGEKTVIAAIEGGANSVQALGKALQCGTNCGSCKPELSQLIEKNRFKADADNLIMLEAI